MSIASQPKIRVSFRLWNDPGNGDPRGVNCGGTNELTFNNGTNGYSQCGDFLELFISPGNLVSEIGSSSSIGSNCTGWLYIESQNSAPYYQNVNFCSWKIAGASGISTLKMRVNGYIANYGLKA